MQDVAKGIRFVDLEKQRSRLGIKLRERVDRVFEHGHFIMGPEVRELEKRLADDVGVPHAISCSSGTDALLLVLMAWGIQRGDAVFTTPFTFIATAEVIALLGATPVFVDIDKETFNLDPAQLACAIEAVLAKDRRKYPLPMSAHNHTYIPKVVIAVDLFGVPADYDGIHNVAAQYSLLVLQDAAQSYGSVYCNGKRCGSLGHCGATSFFPAKPLGCYGDGGAVFTDSHEWAEIIASLRIHGQGAHKYDNVRIGINGRLDTLQAAILLEKLEIFPEELKARQKVASTYTKALQGWVQTPKVPEGCTCSWAQYTIRTPHRDRLQQALQAQGIPTAVYYPKPLHLQAAFASLGYREGDFPVAEEASRTVLSLPMHPYLDSAQIDFIAHSVRSALR
ncbi:DegT/DnrJ/EryC1/StrS family aminotransferase [Desulfosoma sp.]|uniref:DegT/DnrJ/EryC1/StrS family aminotransferase n=1 Tax=Desulfosoma sp. TaxID=2603217 RepID=UPI004049EB06